MEYILGLDCSLNTIGMCVLDLNEKLIYAETFNAEEVGVWRLHEIREAIKDVIQEFKPRWIFMEGYAYQPFATNNTFTIGEAGGVYIQKFYIGGYMNQPEAINLDVLADELPKEWASKQHEANDLECAYLEAEAEYDLQYEKAFLANSASLSGSGETGVEAKAKAKATEDTAKLLTASIKAKAKWRRAQTDADMLDKRLMTFHKQADKLIREMYQMRGPRGEQW